MLERRRYLARMDTGALGHLYTDYLVIGGGIAGLRAALAAAPAGKVIVLAKESLKDSNSYYAQGGIASVVRAQDSADSHIADTLQTGCGLCDSAIVEKVVKDGPAHIRQLQQWGVLFDTEGGSLAAGREGGHSHCRIIHADGDATGRAVMLTLIEKVRVERAVKVFENCFCIDLLTEPQSGECLGVLCYHPKHGLQCVWARKTILAAGGAGRLYRETTNPIGATADGLAMAYRAGAIMRDMEFMQFHPTTLYIAGADRKLITEALRGAGGYLIDRKGKRFMHDYNEMAELAPRDIVSRAIQGQMEKTNTTNVFLDVRHLGGKWLNERFPTISELCSQFDIDVDEDPIPVRPSAHYMIGGVKTDIAGRTSLANLYCCGESSATGLHGANRLASNSLLEGLVFGDICGRAVADELDGNCADLERCKIVYDIPESQRTRLDIADVTNSLRSVMWRNVGIERNGERLAETVEIIRFWQRYVMDKVFDTAVGWQCQNMLTVSRLMAESSLKRTESRGVHYRSDYPAGNDDSFLHHIELESAESDED